MSDDDDNALRIELAEALGWDGIFKDDDGDYCGIPPRSHLHQPVENKPIPTLRDMLP